MAHVIHRLRTRVTKSGRIVHTERRVPWARADRIAGRRLDRRKNYAIIKGQVCSIVSFTSACSGCCEEIGADRGSGCNECGYTGRSRQAYWMPDDGSEPK